MVVQTEKFPSVTRFLAVVLMTAAAATTATAQTALQAQLALRPLTRDDIAAYKLPASTQVSPGLYTVGVGEPVYLEAQVNIAVPASDIVGVTWALTNKPAGSAAALADSPLGAEVPIYEPSDRVVSRVAGRSLLRPDAVGLYTVTAAIATVSSGTANVAQTIIGGTYVGIQTCAVCHSGGLALNMAASWSKTAHASIFKEGVDGIIYKKIGYPSYPTTCFSCHTVGYDADPKAVNGGFDDIAAKLKWTPPTVLKEGNFDAMPDALKNVANIQCENCHGPGSQHVRSGGNIVEISIASNSGACSQCHAAATHHVKSAEWANSMHAVTTRDPSGAGREGCVGCHTGVGFLDKMNGATTINTAYRAINCQTCHEPHGETTPGTNAHLVRNLTPVKLMDGTTVTNAGQGTLCMNCHRSRQNAAIYAATTAGSARFGPHHGPQADMLEGVNGFTYGRSIPSSAHADVVKDTCVACHMQTVGEKDAAFLQAGGHTFRASLNDGTNPRVDLVAACQNCHGPDVTSFNFALLDYDGDGVIEGVQTEVQHLLDQLALLLPPAGQAKSSLTIDSTWTQPQLEAAYNWQFVNNDGSLGVHNMAYAVGLLKTSIANLGPSANK